MTITQFISTSNVTPIPQTQSTTINYRFAELRRFAIATTVDPSRIFRWCSSGYLYRYR
ncbi:hypothetical protein [Aphanothece sacrum]|uniref:hypothetical protein n=1 Tax=Aphanothece sacrum TaxID=1122 RepID=UPI001561F8F5|nr:hypothetical protein [Aphanothece sacrum]